MGHSDMHPALRLHDGARSEVDYLFTPPFPWERVRTHEIMRRWHVVHETPKQVLLMHSSGALVRLQLDSSGKATRRDLLEGPEAEAVLRGKTFSEELAWKAGEAAVADATPLRDNQYKIRMLKATVAHALIAARQRAKGGK